MSSDGNRIVVAFSRKDEHRAYNYIRTLERNADWEYEDFPKILSKLTK